MFIGRHITDRTIAIGNVHNRRRGEFKPNLSAMTTAFMCDLIHKSYGSVDPIGLPGGRCLAAIKAASVLAGRDWNRSISRASH